MVTTATTAAPLTASEWDTKRAETRSTGLGARHADGKPCRRGGEPRYEGKSSSKRSVSRILRNSRINKRTAHRMGCDDLDTESSLLEVWQPRQALRVKSDDLGPKACGSF